MLKSLIDDPAAPFVPFRHPLYDVAGEMATEQAKQWIQTCQRDHAYYSSHGKYFLPTRVIDVGLGDNTASVKLHITEKGETAMYYALSYCWGGVQSHTLSTRNLDAWKQGIIVAMLPKTLRDAIEVTRRLSIRYLWIDALCIIQESAVDKAQEIGRIRSVYKNAMVTIVAASARGVANGFLSVRESLPSCTLPF